MTTVREARAELVAALESAGAPATDTPGGLDPPYVYVAGQGIEPARVMAGQVDVTFRCIMIGGAWDEGAAVYELDGLKQTVLETLRALDGYAVGGVSRDGAREWAGGLYLAAEVDTTRRIDL